MKRSRMSGDERKADIVRAALPLFAYQGFAATTTKQLAQAAGVSEALLYHHFPSKVSLYNAIKSFGMGERDHALVHLISQEPSTKALVQMVFGLMYRFVLGKGTFPMPPEIRVRLMVNSCLEDGVFMRFLSSQQFRLVVEKVLESVNAAIAAGDIVKGLGQSRVGLFFTHHLAIMIGCIHLPTPPGVDYGVSRQELVKEATMYALRGLGVTDDAIRRNTHWEEMTKMMEAITS